MKHTGDGEVEVDILTKLKLKVQLLKGTTTRDAECVHQFLGPHGCPKIPWYVPADACSDAANELGIAFTQLEYPPGEKNESPGPGDFLRAQENFEIRLTGCRFWSPVLVVSKQAEICHRQSGALKNMNFCVGPELSCKDPEMYVVLPTFKPGPHEVLPTKVTFDFFAQRDVIVRDRVDRLNRFFFGNQHTSELQLVAEEVFMRTVHSEVPKAFAGPKQVNAIKHGCDPTQNDIHGLAPHEIVEPIDFRANTGKQVLGILHLVEPWVQKSTTLPLRKECERWVHDMEPFYGLLECPVGRHSVMYPPDFVMFFLKTDTSEKAIDAN